MHCPACGVEVVEQAVYCHKCGERLLPAENGPPAAAGPGRATKTGKPADAPNPAAPARRDTQEEPEAELWRGGYSSKAMTRGVDHKRAGVARAARGRHPVGANRHLVAGPRGVDDPALALFLRGLVLPPHERSLSAHHATIYP